MRKLSLGAVLLACSAITTPVLADGHLQIVEGDPLELTIQMNHARYPVYEESWPVEQQAREWTNVHLVDVTVGANMRTDENTGRTEALNLMLAGGTIPDIVGSSRIKDFVNQYGPEGAFLPLNDLIEEHAPNLKAYFDERPEIAAAISAADGQMYYIPIFPTESTVAPTGSAPTGWTSLDSRFRKPSRTSKLFCARSRTRTRMAMAKPMKCRISLVSGRN